VSTPCGRTEIFDFEEGLLYSLPPTWGRVRERGRIASHSLVMTLFYSLAHLWLRG